MSKHKHSFGGAWTRLKLESIKKYLELYTAALKNQSFNLTYVDAFAGTGYQDSLDSEDQSLFDLPELQESLRGSAHNALSVKPTFHKYVFVDIDMAHCDELRQMVSRHFATLSGRVEIICGDANEYLLQFCRQMATMDRAVLFLDPYGLQVKWETVKAIAATQRIDMWYLLPLGIAVNRLLRKDARIQARERLRLDTILGEHDSYLRFYRISQEPSLFGGLEASTEKSSMIEIAHYFHDRLQQTFAGVARKNLMLYNSKNNPLFVLYFALGNPSLKAQRAALKFADYVLKD